MVRKLFWLILFGLVDCGQNIYLKRNNAYDCFAVDLMANNLANASFIRVVDVFNKLPDLKKIRIKFTTNLDAEDFFDAKWKLAVNWDLDIDSQGIYNIYRFDHRVKRLLSAGMESSGLIVHILKDFIKIIDKLMMRILKIQNYY